MTATISKHNNYYFSLFLGLVKGNALSCEKCKVLCIEIASNKTSRGNLEKRKFACTRSISI